MRHDSRSNGNPSRGSVLNLLCASGKYLKRKFADSPGRIRIGENAGIDSPSVVPSPLESSRRMTSIGHTGLSSVWSCRLLFTRIRSLSAPGSQTRSSVSLTRWIRALQSVFQCAETNLRSPARPYQAHSPARRPAIRATQPIHGRIRGMRKRSRATITAASAIPVKAATRPMETP